MGAGLVDGVGVEVGDGLGEGVVSVVDCSSCSEGVGVGVGETVTVTRRCVFSSETVIVCVPASAVGTVTALLKYPLVSTVAVSK